MKIKSLLSLFPILGIGLCHAQSATIASGGNATGSSGNVSYAIGNVFYQEISGSGGFASQGTQVFYEITSTLGVDQQNIDLQMSVFPNPVTDRLNLKIANKKIQNFSFELYDAKGSKIQNKKVFDQNTSIDMSGYPAGLYIFSVKDTDTVIKTFKIIKK